MAGYRPPATGGRWHSPKQLKESEKEGDQMATIVCEECFEIYGNATDYLSHKAKDHKEEE